jgi:hypothetical protein
VDTTLILCIGAAVLVSLAVHFLLHYGIRVRIRRLELDLAEWEARLVSETKKRAARMSAEVRSQPGIGGPTEEEARLLMRGGATGEPWWAEIMAKGRPGKGQ